jgi:toxin ParE1/3/4
MAPCRSKKWKSASANGSPSSLVAPCAPRPEAIAEYIAEDSPAYAAVVVKNIVQQTRQLSQFPRSGRKVPEFDDENIRELLAYSYRIIYRFQENEVLIAAVIHGKRILQ